MDPERLEELRKQRAKLEEELAKLESEIGGSRPAAPSSPAPQAFRPTPPRPARPAPTPARPIGREAEELFEKLSASEKIGAPSKSGCWVVFSVVLLAVVAIATLVLYMIYK